jgi:hypothetical protein
LAARLPLNHFLELFETFRAWSLEKLHNTDSDAKSTLEHRNRLEIAETKFQNATYDQIHTCRAGSFDFF